MYEKGGVGTLAEIMEFYKGQQVDTTMIELLNQMYYLKYNIL